MANGDAAEQGLKMGASTVVRNASNESALQTATLPAFTAGKVAGETAGDTVRTMGKMRDILVEGNTVIHDSAGRAYDAFLKGESSGVGGMESLKKAGYYPGSKDDPMGMYTEAFGQYKQARDLGLEAQKEKDPSKRDALVQQREDLMKNANIKLFIHEQKSLEQPHMYGDKDMKAAVQSIGGSMVLEDPHGRYSLLPKGGDWTDFNSRMGFKEVKSGTPGAISVPNADGTTTNYQVDPNAVGTVSHYSNSRTAGSLAPALSSNQPAPLIQAPTTATGKGVDRIGTAIDNGNYVQALGNAAQLPERLTADGLQMGGQGLSSSGVGSGVSAIQQYAANSVDTPGLGDDVARLGAAAKLGVAGAKFGAGQAMQAAGSTLNTAIEARDWLWNKLF
jgi:hypothetical protein